MEHSRVLYNVIELGQESVLDKLSLQERLFVNRAVEKSLEANVPKEVVAVLLSEEVLLEVPCKV